MLATSLHGIEQRVAALEAYASQVAEADARYAEVREIEQLDAGSDGPALIMGTCACRS
ncbi:hypothetical protein [Streptomyces sp. NPDC046859]|uniref:hypothetical protein n=1 Tax=Streptomyces sp. NPDC046859 TaxID=3155734 RepID=UPI0033FE4E58